MRHAYRLTAILLLGLPAAIRAADLVVDAGGGSSFTTIGDAMAAAAPGDRILVEPGQYPAFQFSKGVHVHGLGDGPGAVTIARVDYHVSHPTIAYDSTISNVTLAGSASAGYLALTGNELPPGVLVLDGVFIQGGVFLGGGGDGFALQMTNSRVQPGPGQGFFDSAVHVGGPGSSVEIVDSTIRGWDATPGRRAGNALRLVGGTRARLSDVWIAGGHGLAGDPLTEAGATAVLSGFWPEPVTLSLDGGATVRGGDAAGQGQGGHAIDLNGSARLGDADVQGGAGLPPGLPWLGTTPEPLPFDLHLDVLPPREDADAGPLDTGASLELSLNVPGAAAIGLSFSLDMPPAGAPFFSIAPQTLLFVFSDGVSLLVPPSPFSDDLSGVMLFAQGLARDPSTNSLHISNSVAVRLDLLAGTR